jgi:hypothetical protein
LDLGNQVAHGQYEEASTTLQDFLIQKALPEDQGPSIALNLAESDGDLSLVGKQAGSQPLYQLRKLVAEVTPNVMEAPWPKLRMASYGVGPKKKSEHFCYISAQKDDVNLGFYYGAELPDPQKLLRGTGKLLRHVKIREPKTIRSRALRPLLKAATQHPMPP